MPAERRDLIARSAGRLAWLSFCLAIVASPIRGGLLLAARPTPPLYTGYTDIVVPWSGLALVATLLCWSVSLAAKPRRIELGPRIVRWPATALVALAWISTGASIDPPLSIFASLGLTLLVLTSLYALNETGSLDRLIVPVAAMVGIQAVVGLGQVATQGSIGLAAFGESQLDPSVHGVSVVTSAAGARLLRAYGLTDHPNILGGLLALSLPLLVLGLDAGRRARRLLVGVVIGLAGAAILVTFSRAAWLAAIVEIAVALALLYGGQRGALKRWGMAMAIAAVACAVVALPYVSFLSERTDIQGLNTVTEAMSSGERVILTDDAVAISLAHPIVGTGPGTFPLALLRARPSLTFAYQPAPVVALDVAAEIGLPASLAYVVLLIAPWVLLVRRRDRWTTELAAISAALAGTTVVSFLDYYTWTFAAGRIWVWVVLGLWTVAYLRATAPRRAAMAGDEPQLALARRSAEARA